MPFGSNGSSRVHWLFARSPRRTDVIIYAQDPFSQQALSASGIRSPHPNVLRVTAGAPA